MSHTSPCLWTQLPQSGHAPCDRYKHACCSHDGHVYVLGGRERRSLKDFWKYSVAYNKWTQMNCSGEGAPEELEEHSMVAHQGFLYVFGGMLDSAFTHSSCALWVFDIAMQRWVLVQGRSSSTKYQVPCNRKGHSAVVLGTSMLVYGGFIDMKGSSQDFWSLDFDTMAWTLLSASQRDSAGPGRRHSHSAVAFQGCMYLFGGLKGLKEQRDFWRWSSCSHAWTSLRHMAGPPRLIGHSAVVYKDVMFVFGGGESHASPKSSLWSYSFSTHTWSQAASLPASHPPNKMYHCSSGLGPNYWTSSSSSSSPPPMLPNGRSRPFKNKCFPVPLTAMGSEGGIELETFSRTALGSSSQLAHGMEASPGTPSCLTFENKAFQKQWSCTEEDLLEEDHGDISLHLPDQLLVLGGRPCLRQQSICVWQMTLTEC